MLTTTSSQNIENNSIGPQSAPKIDPNLDFPLTEISNNESATESLLINIVDDQTESSNRLKRQLSIENDEEHEVQVERFVMKRDRLNDPHN